MEGAHRAHAPVRFEVLLPDDLAAAFALLPEAFRTNAALPVFQLGGFAALRVFPPDPGHATLYFNAGTDAPARSQTHGKSALPAWRVRVHAETSWRRVKLAYRRAPSSRPEGRRDRR